MEPPIPKCCALYRSDCKHLKDNNCYIFAKLLSINPKKMSEEELKILPVIQLKEMLLSKTKTLLNSKSEDIMLQSLSKTILSNYTRCVYDVTSEIENRS